MDVVADQQPPIGIHDSHDVGALSPGFVIAQSVVTDRRDLHEVLPGRGVGGADLCHHRRVGDHGTVAHVDEQEPTVTRAVLRAVPPRGDGVHPGLCASQQASRCPGAGRKNDLIGTVAFPAGRDGHPPVVVALQ